MRERSGQSYNGSIRSAPAVGRKTCGAVLQGLLGPKGSGPAQDLINGRARLRYSIVEFRERLGQIVTVVDCGFQTSGGIGDFKCADRARRAFQLVRQYTRISWQAGKGADQADSLGREHREHLVLEDERLVKQVKNAGSVFVGPSGCQRAGSPGIQRTAETSPDGRMTAY